MALEVVLAAHDQDYDADDAGWRMQLATLRSALRDAELDVELRSTPVAGEKGGVSDLILTLGTSGAISAAVAVTQNWLARARNRVIEFTIIRDGKPETYRLTGNSATDETFKEIMVAALGNTPSDG